MAKNSDRTNMQSRVQRRTRTSLVDLAYEAIAEAIIDRRFDPGEKLNIDGLAEELDMSNTPVREALARLATERLVIQDSHHRSYMVAPVLNQVEYNQLFNVRYLLEVYALEVAQIDPAAIEELEGIVAQMPFMDTGPIYHDYKDFIHADKHFHQILVRMSGNRFLIEAWDNLHFHLHVGRLYAGTGVFDFREGLKEHRAIVDALAAGSKEEPIRLLKEHIKHAQSRLGVLIDSPQE
jgi:DNA-binding GntR family transcriptional regulator